MNNSLLIKVIVDNILFFEMSSDDAVQPDVAVAQVEAIAAALQRLSLSERQEFLKTVDDLAKAEKERFGMTEKHDHLTALGENLGLA